MDKQTQLEIHELKKIIKNQAVQYDNLRTAIAKLHQEVIRTKSILKRTTENGNRNRKDINSVAQTLSKR